jgi:hypothetical protein
MCLELAVRGERLPERLQIVRRADRRLVPIQFFEHRCLPDLSPPRSQRRRYAATRALARGKRYGSPPIELN